MAIAVCVPDRDITTFIEELKGRIDDEIIFVPESAKAEDVEFAVLWKHPPSTISSLPNLKLICSFGAGVDHILSDPEYDPSIPVTRIVDEQLTDSMTRYVVAAISMFQYGFHFSGDEKNRKLNLKKALSPAQLTIGILGLGALGQAAAKGCSDLGYEVRGLSRTIKNIGGVRTYSTSDMDAFLSETNILVCMLPLTVDTQKIINYELLRKLKRPTYFINVGRGSHVDEIDLLRAVQEEILSGACLDVVQNEPISEDNPFLKESRIIMTPHVASITNQKNAARIIAENIKRYKIGNKLLHQVDPFSGY